MDVAAQFRRLHAIVERVIAADPGSRDATALAEVSDGLNRMLAEFEALNDTMQTRIREAAEQVEQRNQQLIESYHRLLALREQLASAEQLASVGQTAANVAHQVGTPLNLISGYVQLLKEEMGASTPHAARLAIIEEQVGKVTSTVRTLLDRSRPVSRKTRTAAGELVSRVVELMQPSLAAAGIAHEIDLVAGETTILVDATNFELSLLNLMSNAVDAMPEGGTLSVRVTGSSGNRVRIDIADTGHGIPDDLLPRIFEPWVSTKKPGRGTGLGLAIARDVVSAHGGTLSVSSSVGVGTTFTIDLPAVTARENNRAAS
jgi:signal transduction histidine kinase